MIISVDPGKACGLIAIRQDGLPHLRMEADPFRTCNTVYDLIERVRPLVVVCERYVIVPRVMTQQTDALEVIGTLRWMCKRAMGVEFVLQSRADRARVTNEMLHDLDLWTKRQTSPGGHVNEATRHAVVYITRTRPEHPIAKRLLGRIEPAKTAIGANDGARGTD